MGGREVSQEVLVPRKIGSPQRACGARNRWGLRAGDSDPGMLSKLGRGTLQDVLLHTARLRATTRASTLLCRKEPMTGTGLDMRAVEQPQSQTAKTANRVVETKKHNVVVQLGVRSASPAE